MFTTQTISHQVEYITRQLVTVRRGSHEGVYGNLKNALNSVTVQNRTHVYMNFFDHIDLGNHLLQLCPQVVKHGYFVHCIYCLLLKDMQLPCTACVESYKDGVGKTSRSCQET